MGPCQYLLAIALVCLAMERSHGYVLRDRSWDSQNTLADALRVIDREKRRLLDEEEYARSQPTGGSYYWEDPPRSEDEEVEEAEREYLSTLFSAPDSDSGYLEDSQPGVYGIPDDDIENEVLEPQYQPNTKRAKVDKEELEDIFLPEHKRNNDLTKEEDDPSQMEYNSNDVSLDEGEVKHLLDTIENAETEVLSKNSRIEDVKDDKDEDEKEEVSEEELEDIMGPNGQEEIQEEDHDTKQEDEEEDQDVEEEGPALIDDNQEVDNEWPAEMNKEWLVDQYMEGQSSPDRTIKKKRSGIGGQIPMDELSSATDGEDENLDLAFLKEYLSLEDEENTNLALALDRATKAQISSRPDQYIPEEVAFLQKAIKDEQKVERLRALIEEATEPRFEEEDTPEQLYYVQEPEMAQMAEKRTAPIDLEQEEAEEQEEELEEAEDEFVRKLLAEKLKEYLFKMAAGEYNEDLSDRGENEIEAEQTWRNSPIAIEDEGATEEDNQINPFLRELLQKYQLGEIEKRSQIPADDDEMCPAVAETTNNCAAARAMGLSLDGEAMDLCNRHQTCYSCGAAHGISADDCDSGYLREADLLCEESEDCKDEAAALYVIMLQDHGYVTERDNTYACEAQCTFDYIVGAGAK